MTAAQQPAAERIQSRVRACSLSTSTAVRAMSDELNLLREALFKRSRSPGGVTGAYLKNVRLPNSLNPSGLRGFPLRRPPLSKQSESGLSHQAGPAESSLYRGLVHRRSPEGASPFSTPGPFHGSSPRATFFHPCSRPSKPQAEGYSCARKTCASRASPSRIASGRALLKFKRIVFRWLPSRVNALPGM